MSPLDQAQYSIQDFAPDPLKQAKETMRLEREEQKIFSRELCRLENDGRLRWHWQRTDRAATGRKGTLDFVLYVSKGRTAHLEFKLPGGRLTVEQQEEADSLAKLGHTVVIVHSAKEALEWLKGRV